MRGIALPDQARAEADERERARVELLNETSFDRRRQVAVYKADGKRGHHMQARCLTLFPIARGQLCRSRRLQEPKPLYVNQWQERSVQPCCSLVTAPCLANVSVPAAGH